MTDSTLLVYGADWCGDCRRTKRYLTENQVPFTWIDITRNQDGEQFVRKTNRGMCSIPTLLFPDGSVLVEPSNSQLASKLKLIPQPL